MGVLRINLPLFVCILILFATPGWALDRFAMTEVAPGIFVRLGIQESMNETNRGAIANIGFIVGRDAVAVIDPGGSAGEGAVLRATIKATTDKPIRYVILSHVHPDHIFGASAFEADKPAFIGHTNLAAQLDGRGQYYVEALQRMIGVAAAFGAKIVMPTETVAEGKDREIDLGGRVLTLRAWPKSHTWSDLTVYDGTTKTLWASDLLFVERLPSIDGSVTGWLKVIDQMKTIPALRAIPGHGPVSTPWPAAIEPERRYLALLADETRKAIKNNVSIRDAAEKLLPQEKAHWLLFDEYNPHNVTAAYKELEWE